MEVRRAVRTLHRSSVQGIARDEAAPEFLRGSSHTQIVVNVGHHGRHVRPRAVDEDATDRAIIVGTIATGCERQPRTIHMIISPRSARERRRTVTPLLSI